MRKYILSMVLLVLLLIPAVLAAGNVKINDFSLTLLMELVHYILDLLIKLSITLLLGVGY